MNDQATNQEKPVIQINSTRADSNQDHNQRTRGDEHKKHEDIYRSEPLYVDARPAKGRSEAIYRISLILVVVSLLVAVATYFL